MKSRYIKIPATDNIVSISAARAAVAFLRVTDAIAVTTATIERIQKKMSIELSGKFYFVVWEYGW